MHNALKYGGYAMIFAETARRFGDFQRKNERRRRLRTARDMAFGAAVGTAVGVAAGLLFAPRSGEETREAISRKTGESLHSLKEAVQEKTENISEAVRTRKEDYLEIADKCADAIREVHKEAARKKSA